MYEWNNSYSVKVSAIDEQHKQLFRSIQELHQAMIEGKSKEKLGVVLEDLLKYTKNHFAVEEKAMVATAYPQYLAHKKEHDEFTKKIMDTVQDFQSGAIGISINLMDFLSQWLISHIQKVDQQYSPYLAK